MFADRVKETSATTGTGTYNLAGAEVGFQTFVAGIATGNPCYYVAIDGTDWEVGIGTVTDAAPDTLSRDTIISSSNADAAVSWGAGTKTIFCTLPASVAFTDAERTKLGNVEALADVTDTANVTAAGALMDSEVDANLKTFALPASTTISAFIKTLLDDADAAGARATLDVDQAGTDNSTDVTLAGSPNYLTIVGQVITRALINLTSHVTGLLPVANGGTNSSTAAGARTNLDVDQSGTDNSTDVTLAGAPNYLTIAGQVITRALINLTSHVTGLLPVANGGTNSSTAGGARTNLGLAIGSDVQAFDTDTAKTDVAQSFTAEQTFKEVKETQYSLTGTVIDPANGTIQYKTLASNTTFTESLVDGQSVTLMIDDGTAYTVTWPTISWVGGSAPTLETTGYNIIELWQVNGVLYGSFVGAA